MKRFSILLALILSLGCGEQQMESRHAAGSANKKEKNDSDSKKSAKKNEESNQDQNDSFEDESIDDESDKSAECEDGQTEKKSIEFTGSRGDKVPGYLWLPPCHTDKKRPAVLAMYGISGDKDSGTIAGVAALLAELGYVTMTIDWPGTGDRGPEIKKADRVLDSSIMKWTVADYGKAVDYLTDQDFVDKKRLGYVGASMGAMTGINFVAGDSRIKASVQVVPIPNPLWGSSAPENRISQLSNRRVFCIYTQSDLSNTVCENVSGKNVVTKEFAGGHELENLREEAAEASVEFLKEHL